MARERRRRIAKDERGRLGIARRAAPLFAADDEVVIIIVKLGVPFERGGAVLEGKGELGVVNAIAGGRTRRPA